ncbi:dihydrofolate reductase family protein [Companilactobacillus sp. DQM5]|uniref:dihydrofolate reductase family protein n=1 Tax=Companilactobacillus sp. DQM5 TaxID=3463359 RepID=UPI004059B02C
MNRSKVTIHMYTSIDGKIDGPHSSSISGSYYSDELFRISNADANGRKTIQMYAAQGTPDLSKYSDENIEYEDWIPSIKSDTWSISFDRTGVCGWEKNYFKYNGHKMRAVEIVTEKAEKKYLSFLQSMQIPYIVGGKEEFDFQSVLVKLKKYFNIDNLAVCGGSIINGAFLRAHLVDEISLVVSPHVNGDSSEKSVFDTFGEYIDDTFEFDTLKKLDDGGIHMIYKKVNNIKGTF